MRRTLPICPKLSRHIRPHSSKRLRKHFLCCCYDVCEKHSGSRFITHDYWIIKKLFTSVRFVILLSLRVVPWWIVAWLSSVTFMPIVNQFFKRYVQIWVTFDTTPVSFWVIVVDRRGCLRIFLRFNWAWRLRLCPRNAFKTAGRENRKQIIRFDWIQSTRWTIAVSDFYRGTLDTHPRWPPHSSNFFNAWLQPAPVWQSASVKHVSPVRLDHAQLVLRTK